MRKAIPWVRVAFGVELVVFSAMPLFGWEPPEAPPAGQAFQSAILDSYVATLIQLVYLGSGLAYLANRYVALATVVLLPVALNIVLFHVFLFRETLPLTLSIAVPAAVMVWACWDAYRPLLMARLPD